MKKEKKIKKKYKYQTFIDISWSDLDANGHVNSLAYARYFENIRIQYVIHFFDFLRDPKMKTDSLLTDLYFRYLGQAFYPARILATTGIVEVSKRQIIFNVTFWNDKEALITSGVGKLLSFDFQKNKITVWPKDFYERIQELREER